MFVACDELWDKGEERVFVFIGEPDLCVWSEEQVKKGGGEQGGGEWIHGNVTADELAGIPVHFVDFVVLLIIHGGRTDNTFLFKQHFRL